MKQTCKICGRTFEAKQKNYTVCSDACRKINRINTARDWSSRNKEWRLESYKKSKWYKAKLKQHYCNICGKPVEWSKFSHPQRHDECVLQEIVKSLNEGNPMTKKQYQQLQARGYDIGMFCEEYADVLPKEYLSVKSVYIGK